MTRKSTGKRLRFEIFKRDNFTCQYCGKQPPDAVLVIDHILPVAKGGDNDSTNLITACEVCNQGKADKELTRVSPRPDADLEWLAMQQEIAELRRYQLAKTERDAVLSEIIVTLTKDFEAVSNFYWKTDWVMGEISSMLKKHSPEDVEQATIIAAQKVATGYVDRYEWNRYAWGILRNLRNEAGT